METRGTSIGRDRGEEALRGSRRGCDLRPARVPALACKGGNGNGKGGGSTRNPDPSITIEDYRELWLGGTVGFETNAVGLAGWDYPMYLWCYQDLNGDGIQQWPNDGGDLAYAEMLKPGDEVTLGGGGSEWLWSGETRIAGPSCMRMVEGPRRVDPRAR